MAHIQKIMEEKRTKGKPSTRGKKLLYFLAGLSADEHVELAHWLISPLHGNSKQFSEMLTVILEAMAESDEPSLSAEMFTDILMPEREVDAKKANYTWVRISQFQDAVFDFIAWKRYDRNLSLQKRFFFEETCDRGWEKYIPNAYQASIKALPEPIQASRFKEEMQVEMAYCHYLAGTVSPINNKHIYEVNLSLDHYFFLQKLKYACADVLDGHAASSPNQMALLKIVLQEVEGQIEALPIVIQTYWYTYKMLEAETSGSTQGHIFFEQFKQLFENPNSFSDDEAMDLFIHGQNFCTLRYRKGETAFVDQLQELYDRVLGQGVALTDGLMSSSFYKNAVELMCRLARYEWVENFVESYGKRILNDPKNISYAYNKAVLSFYRKEYSAVVGLLYNIISELDDFHFGTGARVYLCQAIWETGDLEWLRNVLKAFQQHLRRNQELSLGMRERYKNFATYLLRACEAATAKPNHRLKKLEKLQSEIETNEPANLHRWIREKLRVSIEQYRT